MSLIPDPPDEATDPLLVDRVGAVAVLTLNRPGSLNAVNRALAHALGAALSEAAADPAVRAIVLTGSGRAFCAGADLREIADVGAIATPGPEWGFAGVAKHWVDKPVIAAVNGPAHGGGLEIVLACDLAVADPAATFALPEVRRGLAATGGGVLRLRRQVPLKAALEIALTGEAFTADRALELGLVNAVSAPGESLSQAAALAQRIAANAPLAVAATKRLVHRAHAHDDAWDERFWERNDAEAALLLTSEDAVEGARAFLERRDPEWRSR